MLTLVGTLPRRRSLSRPNLAATYDAILLDEAQAWSVCVWGVKFVTQ